MYILMSDIKHQYERYKQWRDELKDSYIELFEEIKKLYDIVNRMDGNFLINFGPKMNGKLDKNELRSYNEFIEMV